MSAPCPPVSLHHRLVEVLLRGVDGVGRAESLGEVQPVVEQVGGDDLASARARAYRGERQADAALPHHQHVLAQDRAHLLAGVQDRAGRLAHHPACQVAVVGQRRHAPFVAVDVLHQSAASPGTGQHDDALAHGELVGAALDDGACRLVAGPADAHGVLFFRMDGAVGVADVAAADRPCFQLDETFAVNDFGNVHLFDFKSLRACNSRCSHGVVTVPPQVICGCQRWLL